MRGSLTWISAILAGIVLVIVVSAAIGDRDREGETVSAGEWAQDVCGTVASGAARWRRSPRTSAPRRPSAASVAEPQSQMPQSRSALVRESLGRAIR